jgi:hypothetical protein
MAWVQYAQFVDLPLQVIAERARSLVTCHTQFGELPHSLVTGLRSEKNDVIRSKILTLGRLRFY